MKRILLYLILPLLGLFFGGIILYCQNFEFIEGYVAASGSVLAALVALFISNNSEFINQKKELAGREIKTEHLYMLLSESEKVLNKEIENYTKFTDFIEKEGMKQQYLTTTPFYFLERISKMDQDVLYDSIVNRNNKNPNDLRRLYLDSIKLVESSIFLKNNAEHQYRDFIESYNRYASQFKDGQLAIDNLHSNIITYPTENKAFNVGFLDIILQYNIGISKEIINIYFIPDILDNLINPLYAHLMNNYIQHPYFSELQRALKIIEVSLLKISEVQNNVIQHFKYLADEMNEIKVKIHANKEILKNSLHTSNDLI